MFSYKSKYCVAAAMAAMAALTGHVEARDIDLQSIGYFQFSPLPPSLVSQTDTLLLSDSPEYVGPVGGTLSAGTINGNGRIYFYHVNEMDQPHKIAIVLENQSAYPNTVHVMRQLKSVATPDYFAAGRDLSRKDLEHPLDESPNARPLYSLSIPPQGRQLIFSDLENTPVYRDELFTGIVDIKTEAPIFARVMMLPMGMDAVDASHWAKNLPIDEIQLRGTYTGSKRNMEVTTPFDTTLGGAFVEIGNDREDMFINGVDEMQNKAFVRDRGNYGVSYTLKIPTKGNEPFRLYFNPLGGPYSGSFTVKALHQQGARRGQIDTRTYHIGGADGISALGDGTILDSRIMGNYNAGDLLTLNFMPAGASNLPIRFLLIPESLANPQKHQTIAVNVPKDVTDSLGHPTQSGTQIPVGPINGKDTNKGTVDSSKSTMTPAKQAETIAHEETKKLSDKAAADAKKEAQLKKAKDAEEALARKKAEEARIAAEKAELARKAAEAKHAEVERKLAEKAEADRKAAELKADQEAQAAKEKAALEAKKAEEMRQAEEAKRLEAERKAELDRKVAEARKAEEERKAEMARIEAARKAEADRLEAARKAEEARVAAEAKRLEEERRIEAARIEAARKAEEARQAAEAKARFEAQRAAEKAALEAKKAEEERLAAEAKRQEELRKAEEARIAAEAKRAEELRKAEEARIAAEAKRAEEVRRAEEARRIEEARRAEEARKAEEARIAAEARKAEQARLAAERAEAERQAAEAKRIAEERYQAHLEAERKAEEARQQALAQAEVERKAKERAEAIQRVKEQQENARHRAELARQQIEAERKAAQAAKTGPSFSELDDVHEDTPSVTIPNAVSIDELTKPRPTASQNTRRRDQRQPLQNQQYAQQNPMTNGQQDQAPYSSQQDKQNDDQNPPKLYPMGQ
ncbi:MAG: ATPase [Veillonella sp.]|uniref:ATPase n=1 Tax=Veillonella sp. TaxID=1926307 RepID=UPI0029042D43|nr:ATPase [Veillonella sp.]MDU0852561.1 ATPase [Veillonella sp.]MDU0924744.1 ATPase [Veillonella sp.]MDU1501228.1 ATPase [Veillonella sp.]MDU1656940.1 ATPase [Veillonella sp.]